MKRMTEERAIAEISALAFHDGITSVAEADVTRIVITRIESPTFNGVSVGTWARPRNSWDASSGKSMPLIPATRLFTSRWHRAMPET